MTRSHDRLVADSQRSVGAQLLRVFDERVLPQKYTLLLTIAALFWAFQPARTGASGNDWINLVHVAQHLGSSSLVVVYVGPVALLVVYPFSLLGVVGGWIACSVLCLGLGAVAFRCLETAAAFVGFGSQRARDRAAVVGGLFLAYAWSLPGAYYGHVDDVIVLTCVAVALRAVVAGRWWWASIAIAVAIDTKPWALLVLPLVACFAGARWRGLILTAVAAAVPALPFVLIHHGHLDVGFANLAVEIDSDLRYAGVAAYSTPSWTRELQIAVAVPLGVLAVVKKRWYLIPAVALATRVNLDPETHYYYMTGAILGVFVWDLIAPSRVPGGRTALSCFVMVLLPEDLLEVGAYHGGGMALVVALRLMVALVAIGAIFRAPALPAARVPGTSTGSAAPATTSRPRL